MRGSLVAALGLLEGHLVTASAVLPVTVLVVAKAPVPGQAKTRLGAARRSRRRRYRRGRAAGHPRRGGGDPRGSPRRRADRRLGRACRAGEIRSRLADFTVVEQRGVDFADRLANAHVDASAAGIGPVLQIGMDTPQVTPELLTMCARALLGVPVVLGMAADGGWWALGVRSPELADCLHDVPMSRADTGTVTLAALRDTGEDVHDFPNFMTWTPSTTCRSCGLRARRRADSLAATARERRWRRAGNRVTARYGRHRTCRRVAGHRVRCASYRPAQSFHSASAAVVLLAHPAGVAVPADPGPTRRLRHRRRSRCWSSSSGRCGPSCSSGHLSVGWPDSWSGFDPGAGGVDDLRALHRADEHRAVVCVQVLLHHQPLRDGLRRRRRGAGAHRGQAAGHPSGARRAGGRRRRRVGPSRRDGAARHRVGRRTGHRRDRGPDGAACCARCPCWRRVPVKGRKVFR